MGTLCSELDKRDDDLERAAAELLTLLLIGPNSSFGRWGEAMRAIWQSP
jgi:hypothetical protein